MSWHQLFDVIRRLTIMSFFLPYFTLSAPEIFTAGVHGGYGNKVDVFSAGVTLYVMLCGYEPFYGESDAELIAANRAAVVDFPDDEWKGVSADAKELVRQMMHPDPRHRLSPSQALQHRWLDQVRHRSANFDLDRSTTLPSTEAPSDDACTIM
jgi:serine/threonine protein kinase